MLIFFAAAAAAAAAPTSAYTALDLRRCTILTQIEEGASVSWRCPGYRGVPLFVMAGDDRFDLDAGVDNEVWESPREFSSQPARVEWRLRGGRPFAIIYRLSLSNEGSSLASILVVETVGRAGAPGCEVMRIHGSVRNANAVARARADREIGRFRCGVDQVQYEGPAI